MNKKETTHVHLPLRLFTLFLFLTVCTRIPPLSVPTIVSAASESGSGITAASFSALRQMFPNGKYWNHVGVSDAEYQANKDKYNYTYSNYACDDRTGANLSLRHNHGSCLLNGACGCNSYDGAIQCMGFAYLIGDYLTGRKVRDWDIVATSLSADWMRNNLQPGDYIRFGGVHSAIVVDVNTTGVKLVEANYVTRDSGANCKISWTDWISFSELIAKRKHGTGTMIQRSASSIKILNDIPTIFVNQTNGFSYDVTGNAQKTDVKWESSDSAVLAVAPGGGIRGVKAGTATVTAYLENSSGVRTCEVKKSVTVLDCKLSFKKSSISLQVGKSVKLSATSSGLSGPFSWKSANNKIATVSSKGVVTGKKTGSTKITVFRGNKAATCKIIVKDPAREAYSAFKKKHSLSSYIVTDLDGNKIPELLCFDNRTWKSLVYTYNIQKHKMVLLCSCNSGKGYGSYYDTKSHSVALNSNNTLGTTLRIYKIKGTKATCKTTYTSSRNSYRNFNFSYKKNSKKLSASSWKKETNKIFRRWKKFRGLFG